MIVSQNIKKQYENLGYIKIPEFINDEHFMKLCDELNHEINKKFEENKNNIMQMGGSLIGNVNIELGKKGDFIWNYLKKTTLKILFLS